MVKIRPACTLLAFLILGAAALDACGTATIGSSVMPVTATPATIANDIPIRAPTTEQTSPSPAQPAPTQALPTEQPLATPTEQPVAAEQNPPGDIPDTQAFVRYSTSTGGYSLEVPEGWARSTQGDNARFVDKLDGLSVTLTTAQTASTAATAGSHEVAALAAAGRAVVIGKVSDVQLPGGPALQVQSTANSDPDLVTNKQVRLEQLSYLFFKDDKLATLTLWAPLGADNVDQWNRIAQSFRWG